MIKIVCVGKIREKSLSALIAEYEKRLSAYTRLDIIEVADEPAPQENSVAQDRKVLDTEGARILKQLKEKDTVILLDLKGKMLSSEKLAEKMEEFYLAGKSDLVFVIGGSLGLSDSVRKRADLSWKLSDLTFPHQIVRLLVLEQVYRAYKINKNEPYHK